MPRRCPNCGTYNGLGSVNCTRCQNSLEHVFQEEEKSLKDLRIYGIIFLITAIGLTLEFGVNIASSSYLGGGFGLGMTSFLSGLIFSNLSVLFLAVEAFSVIILFVEAISFVYLRSSFNNLKKYDYSFSTPATGMTLLVIGIIMAIIGLGAALALLFPLLGSSGNTPVTPTTIPLATFGIIALSALVGLIGGILLFIGYIMGVLLGLHRLSIRFEESYFDYTIILIIVSLLFTPISLIAAILVLLGIRKSKQRINDAGLEELMAIP